MKKIAVAVAIAAAGIAAPAMADEARVEVRSGAAFDNGRHETQWVLGVAAGYDFDLADSGVFVGGEGSLDLVAGSTDSVFGLTGRVGAKLSDADRLYATGGYSFNGVEGVHAGAGYQHRFGKTFYGKVEYRHVFDSGSNLGTDDEDVAVIGIGLAF